MSRRIAREVAVRALFQVDVGRSTVERAVAYNLESFDLSEKDAAFARRLVEGTLTRLEAIDYEIDRAATRWTTERMAKTDRNILRLAVYELAYEADVPASVTVNEAVELAKAYGDADSGKFVNGVLGQVLRGSPST